MTISPRTIIGFALSTLVAGCGRASTDPTEAQVAADGTQAMAASSQSTHLANVVFENVSVSDPDMAAEQVSVHTELWPSGCVTRAKDPTNPNVVHVILDDCTGPFGLVHIDGEEVVTFSVGAGGALHVAITGTNLRANGKPVTFSATADVTFPTATSRSVVWQGSWTRTNDAGDTVAHTSDLQIAVDLGTHCSTSNGSARTTVANREVDTSVAGYELCRNPTTGAVGCPSGTVTHTGKLSGKTVTVAFDATNVAEVTGAKGHTFAVDLVCTPLAE